jgi:hypothetical protein
MGTRGWGFLSFPLSPTLFYYYSLLLSLLLLLSLSLSLIHYYSLLSLLLSLNGGIWGYVWVNPFTERK